MTTLLAALIVTFALTASPAAAQKQDDTEFAQRLARLVERMEQERIQNHIPGLALVVVKDDQVVLARGFGLANIEENLPVKPDTLFAIGSSTKAFTATLAGMLQDDGVLDFDDPVTQYLPNFKLPIEGPDQDGDSLVTLRDLLCHRTGFTRMSMLWGTNAISRELVLKTAVQAEPWAGFRETFLYNNLMYLAAGMATAAATGEDGERVWDRLIDERIFTPLGMDSSNLSVTEAQTDKRLALGYEWNGDSGKFEHKPMFVLDTIGPAGAINSNILDMAQWLRLQLGRGEVDGKRLIQEKTLLDTWTENIKIAGEVGYGLGWMLRERQGQRIIEHGGNINGFGAQVAFMPDADIGYVLLTNVTATPLQQGSIPIVFGELLDAIPSKDEAGAVDALDLTEYVGGFDANFASFKDATFEVLIKNGNLAVDVPGQQVFELHTPDEGGKWYFRLTDTVAVSFKRNDSDEVAFLVMHQGGMNFELPKQGVDIDYGEPLADAERFLGEYRNQERGKTLSVFERNNRLVVDVPGEMGFELHGPDASGRRNLRVTDAMGVTFNEDAEGRVVSLTWFRPNGQRDFERINLDGGPAKEPLPTVGDLLEKRGGQGRAELLAKHGTMRIEGSLRMAQSGIAGTFVYEARSAPPAYRLTMDFGDFGGVETGAGDGAAWTYARSQGYTPMNGDMLKQALRNHPSFLEGDWRQTFEHAAVKKKTEEDGRTIFLVEVKWGDLPARTMELDAETGEVCGMNYIRKAGIMSLPMETTYRDYREVDGVQVSHVTIEENEATGRSIETTETIELGVELADDFHVHAGEK